MLNPYSKTGSMYLKLNINMSLKLALIILIFHFPLAVFSQSQREAQDLKEFQKMSKPSPDSTDIFAFASTTCKPCIASFPKYEQIKTVYPELNIRVWLICYDNNPVRLKYLFERTGYKSGYYLLKDPSEQLWAMDDFFHSHTYPHYVLVSSSGKRYNINEYFENVEKRLSKLNKKQIKN